MGFRTLFFYGLGRVVAGFIACVLAGFLPGCQATQSVSVNRLIAHQALIDFSGLKPSQTYPELKVAASVPQRWEVMPLKENPLYTHQQWRSPTRSTGVGVALVHMPFQMSAKTIVWFAKTQYASQAGKDANSGGRLIGEWTDSIGREWFEAENAKYHVRGYAVTSGYDAWIVYSGYRLKDPLNPVEIGMASRSMDSILPTPLVDVYKLQVTAAAR